MFAEPILEERELRRGALAVTNSNGHYCFNSIAAGKYNVIVSPRKAEYTMAALESIEATAGATKSLPDARLIRGGTIVGRVIDAETGRPVRPVSSGPSPSPLYIRMYGPSCPRNSGVCNTAEFRRRLVPIASRTRR